MAEKVPTGESQEVEKISIVGRNLQVTAPLRDHILLRLHKAEETTPGVIGVNVYLEVQKLQHRAEILYRFSHFTIMAHGTMNDMYQAFDLAYARLKKKLRKWKTQIQSHRGKKPSDIELSIQVLDKKKADLDEINDLIEEETIHEVEDELAPPTIVKKEKKMVPLLTMEEAAMRIDFSEDQFLVYRSEEDMHLKVMYVRPDHTLGILDVE